MVARAEERVVDSQVVWGRRRVAAWAARALVLGGLLLVVVVLPTDSPLGIVLPLAIEVVTVAVVAAAAARKPAMSRAVWWCIAGSVALTTTADLIYAWQQNVSVQVPFPGWADPFYLAAYLPLLAATVLLIHYRLPDASAEERLDTAVITVPLIALAALFVIEPGISGQTFSPATVLAATYPVLDMVVLAALVRLSIGLGHRNRSLGLLIASVSVTLFADLLFTALAATGQVEDAPGWSQALFTMGVLLMTAAALSTNADTITRPERILDDRAIPTGRVIALAVASVSLPAVAILGRGVANAFDYTILAIGTVSVNLLIGWRALRLFSLVNVTRRELDQIARTDALTSLPNRRSWDFEVQRWDARATQAGHLLTIAILDIDHFKDYNDQHGHLAGDALLQDCARAWREALPPDAYLARYGGDEFAAILPDTPMTGARPLLEELRQATPQVTVSIGYAEHRPDTTLTEVLADADATLYAAKQAGRNRVSDISARIETRTRIPTNDLSIVRR